MATSYVKDAELLSFFIYNPTLGVKEGTEHQKILYYYPEDEAPNRKVRNVGLCEALVNFTKTFNPDKPCQAVHTDRKRQVFLEPEHTIWTVMTVSIPWVELVNNGEKTIQYSRDHVQDEVLEAALERSYNMFKLFNGSYGDVCAQCGLEALKGRLQRFYSRYLQTVDISKLDIFSVFQGMQFLPLDKYMYLKAHCFVNLIETTYRNIQRTVFLFGDQVVWSGLGQEDIKIFYQYLLTWLFPSYSSEHPALTAASISQHHSLPSLSLAPIPSSLPASAIPLTNVGGSFLIGQSGSAGELGKSPWVYVTVDGVLQSCKLYVYNVGNATMCFFVKSSGKSSPSSDFCKRLGTFLGPRLSQLARDIGDFVTKSKTTSPEQQYKYVYFNELNLAVKSYLSGVRRTVSPLQYITPEAMRLITQLNTEYNELDEGETIVRTLSDFWVVCRKSGHRRFFVILTQRNANFAEINGVEKYTNTVLGEEESVLFREVSLFQGCPYRGVPLHIYPYFHAEEVRKLCQREFTNIFFLD